MSSFGWFSAGPAMPGAYATAPYASQSSLRLDPAGDAPDLDRPPELADLRRLARRGLRGALKVARAPERPVPSGAVREHLGGSVGDVVAETWAGYEMVNVQRALDVWLGEPGRTHTVHGVHGYDEGIDLAGLMGSTDPDQARLGPVQRTNRSCGPDGKTLACVTRALVLVEDAQGSHALYVRQAFPGEPRSAVGITSTDAGAGIRIAAELKRLASKHNVFRGQVLSFGGDMFAGGDSVLAFHRRPSMTRADLILDDDVLAAVERQIVGVARHREALLAAGQHLKRGVLLYGPPGVGKTHTVRYLVSTLPGVTVIEVSGDALHLIAEACSAARSLAPSLVVVEDVDLIAEDRGMHPGQHPMLFQLLNEMDGIAGDVDVAFVLTTNRADLLEPALAARPGRVDEAVAIDLPDFSARRRLFDLYRGHLRLEASDERIDAALERAQGVTASFLKELLRRTTLVAAERATATAGDGDSNGSGDSGEAPVATADDLDAALDGLLATRSRMTRTLLGGDMTKADDDIAGSPEGAGVVGGAGWTPDLPGGGSDSGAAQWGS
ncbi:ATP-binding protein [Mobilicoccus massiliensis]|uniref:ATP-binding protein n=1 Tax=Mobilicoccus massiliensis TaxID=1522310 RepID=UPI000694903D|nr:ATP-binding protein [Mobilicoccus massiliensis]